jgi:AraC-like DNA-binding protein
MFNFAITCLRALDNDEPAARAAARGDMKEVLRSIDVATSTGNVDADRRAILGQLHGRLLIAAGRDGEAEEVFQRLLQVYSALPRMLARIFASLDRGVLELSQKRFGRAAVQFNSIADDETAPPALRIEALVGLASALQVLGEARRMQSSLAFAVRLALPLGLNLRLDVLTAMQLDFDARAVLLRPDRSKQQALAGEVAEYNHIKLHSAICNVRTKVGMLPLLSNHLGMLATLLCPQTHNTFAEGIRLALKVLRNAGFDAFEDAARIDALLFCVALSRTDLIEELLCPLVASEPRLERHRHAIELTLCSSHLHAARGRHDEALRLYRWHSDEVLQRLRRELPLLPYSRFLEKDAAITNADASELRLPLRYRKAYRFIIEQLSESELSIRQVAAHIDVTERALQMTFRTNLGMSPAEVIRHRRLEKIRSELLHCDGHETVLDVASRWGIPSRSTFTQNYRQQFGEAPSSTLRGSMYRNGNLNLS